LISSFLCCVPLAAWLYLLLGRGGFWQMRERDTAKVPPAPSRWPSVAVVVPARNEADTIRSSVGSLLSQEYPGRFRVIVVDDQSEDATGKLARGLGGERLTVLTGSPRPTGWAGKLWAMEQGVRQALAGTDGAPEFLWFADADIAHRSDTLASLVARAEGDQPRVLVSLMARLSCRTPAERFLIPAFVFFFAMLYPFGAVNDPRRRTSAAAGGCMLVRAESLRRAGGLETIRGALIDDCALARRLKPQGAIWLGLTDRSVSLRPYRHISDVHRMVARSAYCQLRYSPLLLALALAGLAVIFIAPPVIAFAGRGPAQLAGLAAWAAMAGAFQPILRFYRRTPAWGLALPVIAASYAVFTLDSALQHGRGRGGIWKGRVSTPDTEGAKSR
jgi:hopene-associated glycosyltransferase HpnB